VVVREIRLAYRGELVLGEHAEQIPGEVEGLDHATVLVLVLALVLALAYEALVESVGESEMAPVSLRQLVRADDPRSRS